MYGHVKQRRENEQTLTAPKNHSTSARSDKRPTTNSAPQTLLFRLFALPPQLTSASDRANHRPRTAKHEEGDHAA